MRLERALLLCLITTAAVAAPPGLEGFLPADLGGVKRLQIPKSADLQPEPGDAAAAYIDRASRRAINVNLTRVKNLAFERAQLKNLAPDATEERPASGLSFKGFEAAGTRGTRTFYKDANKSEAAVLVNDAVVVRVSVQPASNPDEAITLLRTLDLPGLLAATKKK